MCTWGSFIVVVSNRSSTHSSSYSGVAIVKVIVFVLQFIKLVIVIELAIFRSNSYLFYNIHIVIGR